jgi:hypothetical protein
MRKYRTGKATMRGRGYGKRGFGEAIKCLQLAGLGVTMPLLMTRAPLVFVVRPGRAFGVF